MNFLRVLAYLALLFFATAILHTILREASLVESNNLPFSLVRRLGEATAKKVWWGIGWLGAWSYDWVMYLWDYIWNNLFRAVRETLRDIWASVRPWVDFTEAFRGFSEYMTSVWDVSYTYLANPVGVFAILGAAVCFAYLRYLRSYDDDGPLPQPLVEGGGGGGEEGGGGGLEDRVTKRISTRSRSAQ